VRNWSFGEVKKPETINYRTFKPERDGLFCERIFGPVKDWECHCGRYKKVKFKGIVCDRCGVEVTRSKVRRERMGHIELCAPVSHIWYLKGVPSPMALLLDLSPRPLEKVVYFGSYIVTKVDKKLILDNWTSIEGAIKDELEQRANAPEEEEPLGAVTLPIDSNEDEESLLGRISTEAVADPTTGEILIEVGDIITQENLDTLTEAGIAEVEVEEAEEEELVEEEHEVIQALVGRVAKDDIVNTETGEILLQSGRTVTKDVLEKLTAAGLTTVTVDAIIRREELSVAPHLVNRIPTIDVVDPATGEVLLTAGEVITRDRIEILQEAGISTVVVDEDESTRLAELSTAPRMLDEIAGDDLEAGLELLQKVERKELLVEDQYRQIERVVQILTKRLGKEYEGVVRAGLGASAIRELLQEIDLDALQRELETEIAQTTGPRRLRSVKRIEIVNAFLHSKSRPEWMVLDAVPVIPPELRPMVQLDGGRFATSDLNDLYRRIINRNNRLKKIQDIHAPESIINHEKRLLQEAVDALIDNGRRTRPVVGSNNRPLRSLSDMLKGKEGRFRKNLLGKRVDYSGRSVIVVGPSLKLNQCGLPKEMALELFKPFVMKALVDAGCTTNIKTAKRMIDRVRPEVWDALEKVIQEHVVMLNRAPTLHRLGIQAFQPTLVDGKAIHVHPLVCAAFGADFDGDQMAVHVPLSSMAQAEGQCLMLSTRNLFKPSDGAPVVAPIQDLVLGLYYETQENQRMEGAGRIFSSVEAALLAYENAHIHLHAPIKVRDVDPDDLIAKFKATHPDATEADLNRLDPTDPALAEITTRLRKRMYDTTAGRLILSQTAPWMMRYPCERNKAKNRKGVTEVEMDKKAISAYIRDTYEDYAAAQTIILLDALKEHGFRYATKSGLSISLTDMDEPEERESIISAAEDLVADINKRYRRGAITAGEREGQVLEAWTGASRDIGDAILKTIGKENPIFMMTESGARGSKTQITQLSGMRGLMSDPFGGIIEELPIKSNFHRGLNILEYFVSTHGQRKGLADTALRTADAGYLTRRLVDVAQDVIIRDIDCGTNRGIYVGAITEAGDIIEPLRERIRGRVTLEDVTTSTGAGDTVDPETGEVLAEGGVRVIAHANTELTDHQAAEIERAGVKRVGIRSPLTCELRQGICAMCYGRDMATQRTAEVGTAVGIIAAQSIGEPGTQLTMRTFHTGGVAGKNIVGVANVKQKKQEALRELHQDIERGHVSLEDNVSTTGATASDRERSRAVQAMLKVLEEQVGGLLRVVELVEGRKPKGQAIITEVDGKVVAIEQKGARRVIIHSPFRLDSGESTTGKVLGEPVVDPESKDIILEAGTELNEKAMRQVRKTGVEEIVVRYSHLVPYRGALEVREGDDVTAGDRLTEGPLDPDRVLELQGITGVQDYMVKEVQSVYKSQGVDINDKHIEVIVRQMLKKRKITDPGDTLFLPGQMVDKFEFEDANAKVRDENGTEAKAEWLLLGITDASLATDSFLSAASFQKTTKVLADAAVKGKKDNLLGLKENVIIGRLIPAGTGLKVYRNMTVGGEAGHTPPKRRPHLLETNDPDVDDLLTDLRRGRSTAADAELASAGMSIEGDTAGAMEPEL
jgi:DNA-directed RNA polymerase subunit beta'